MPKRLCPFTENGQAIKKKVSGDFSKLKTRPVLSNSAEKTLQLLYQGANQINETPTENQAKLLCFVCGASIEIKSSCFYCDKNLCEICKNTCNICNEEFCKNCCLAVYTEFDTLCYSCYK